MALCPVCHANIEDDFGLVTCGSCGAQVMAELDGVVAHQEAIPSAGDEAISPAAAEMLPPVPEEISTVLQNEVLDLFDVPPPQPPPLESPAQPVSQDLSDVAEFANSDASLGREGLLRFNLFLSGIDSADIRQMVLDALVDERFLWDADKIISTIQKGQLQIKEITAVKSALLVQKLRAVPIEIRWEQHAIF